MSVPHFVLRPAGPEDHPAIAKLAGETGPGFTNIPNDADALAQRLHWSGTSFEKDIEAPEDELYIFVLEELATKRVCGTAMIFSKVGVKWPFYSYKITWLSQYSQELDRIVRLEVLNLVNDLEGASEVGGLFLSPDFRSSGVGKLLARSRYMFMKMHRERFADRVISELRGFIDDDGRCPFWDGLAGKFFEMEFRAADLFNSLHGNQFIADLMPKYPIYSVMLPDDAREAIGKPHDHGGGAATLLKREGFEYRGYVDIFDGGPTMIANLEDIKTVSAMRNVRLVGALDEGEPVEQGLLACDRLTRFRAWSGEYALEQDGGIRLHQDAIDSLELEKDQEIALV